MLVAIGFVAHIVFSSKERGCRSVAINGVPVIPLRLGDTGSRGELAVASAAKV
jgi:hypothetical protein